MSSASHDFDENVINQYLSQDLIGVIKCIKFVHAKGSEMRTRPRYRFYVFPDANVTRKDSQKKLEKNRSTIFSTDNSKIQKVIEAAQDHFKEK